MNVSGIIFSDLTDKKIPELTKKRTLASVPFGGRYRFIDFTISNMVNSGIKEIGIIIQNTHDPLVENAIVNENHRTLFDEIKILSPAYSKDFSGLIRVPFSTHLEALISINRYIEKLKSDYVVLSDCDYIYNVDLSEIITAHTKKKAHITFVSKKMFISGEQKRKTIIETDKNGRITDFLVDSSYEMGYKNVFINLWVINRPLLQKIVFESISMNYKNMKRDYIRPKKDELKLYVYDYEGYTLSMDSLSEYYKANMDILNIPINQSSLFGIPKRPIYTKDSFFPPPFFSSGSNVTSSLIGDGCIIKGSVENSIVFPNVTVSENSSVKNSIIFQGSEIGIGSTLNCVICDNNAIIKNDRILSGHPSLPFFIAEDTII